MHRRPTQLAALPLVAALAVLAACSDDDGGALDVGPTGTTAAPASSTTTTAPRPASELPFSSVNLTMRGSLVVGLGSAGLANADLTYDGDQMCLTGSTSNVGPVTAAHVHAAPADQNGDPVIDFGITTAADGDFEGCSIVGAEAGVVFDDPTNYYVDLHTADLPDGAVRAQVG